VKISKRLNAIDGFVSRHYQHVWDCCCDHGNIGRLILERKGAETVHFVDVVPSIMAQLERQLCTDLPQYSQTWQLHTKDVRSLPIDRYPQADKHLIIIAGVGGELTLAMVSALVEKFSGYHLEFLLCPVRHQYKLRQGLSALGLALLAEALHKEQKWYYEIIHLAVPKACLLIGEQGVSTFPVVATGSQLWQQPSEIHQSYLAQTLAHYQRSLRSLQKNTAQYRQVLRIFDEYDVIYKEVANKSLDVPVLSK